MRIVIIGNGMASFKLCEKLRTKGSKYAITVFGEENQPAYDRVHLSEFFSGRKADDLFMAPKSWYHENDIQLHLGDPVKSIDRLSKKVHSFSGETVTYDNLILATGSAAFIPPVPGIEKQGVFLYRTIEDLEMIRSYSAKVKNAVVMGGGLLGLEAAKAMLDLGIKNTHVIEFANRLMPRQLDIEGAGLLKNKLSELGLHIHHSKNTVNISGEEKIHAVEFADGSFLETDMLVISAGIRPRDELAHQSGLAVGPRGGIIINDILQTSDPSIYAIGECALHNKMIYGLVAPAYEMAEVLSANLMVNFPEATAVKTFTGFDMSTKLKLIGVDVASFGDPFIENENTRTIAVTDKLKGNYKRINISADGKQLLGGILVGDTTQYNMMLQTCRNKMLLPADPMDILHKNTDQKKSDNAGITALPEDALICSCESVTKAGICQAVSEQNCNTVDAIKKCTKAGTGCGGCVPMIKDLMVHTMKEKGIYIRNVVCEHFQYSRQELFDLIKIQQTKTFNEVLDTFGKGDGCEVCKPLVSSLIASIWNEMILRKGNDSSQDSNDRFLANIQKGGTYSVVPRIPGGEITPDKLIVIGEVAKKYNLYTKITGAQRIDMFGAHVSDLPNIWTELISAGFESGHAYGKALRTVKSCVGSTWCRFGLHDSVSYAIRIEERYRGFRAPHKIKSAVSGCIRECAEAQSKDFGIIATEKGWNLYVCGNGGSKPQHAQLLATDLDSDTCIKYIDRFLMFYLKTADPLNRTATWLNKMEGGIEYLRNVVVNDSLGMAEEWEAAMQHFADSYACEWKAAIETPEIRKRFSHFINAPEEKDPSVQFEEMRGQKKVPDWNNPK
ncbi:MAG: nitrite reductase large subunit [Gemmatimonadaceae bacterium]|nr:nitrite reductase large subunit [Chitinophagaceae bacterium]